MLRMLIKAYYVNVVVYISTETIIFYCKEEKVHWEWDSKKSKF